MERSQLRRPSTSPSPAHLGMGAEQRARDARLVEMPWEYTLMLNFPEDFPIEDLPSLEQITEEKKEYEENER